MSDLSSSVKLTRARNQISSKPQASNRMTNWESVVVTSRFDSQGCFYLFIIDSGLGLLSRLLSYILYLDSDSLYKETDHIIYHMIILSIALAHSK